VTARDVVVFLLLGLGPGAVYAALGLGIVAMYRGSGVLNIAFGAMAMYPAYVYASLRSSGDLVLPGIPGTHHVADRMGALPALAIALVVSALLGLVAYALVFRRLRSAPPVASIVGALGVLLILQIVVVLRFGGDPRLVDPLLPHQRLTIGGSHVPADRLWLVVLVAVVAIAMAFVSRATRFGLASRAAAERSEATELLGVSTVRLGAINWVVGAVIAGLFGILLAPIAGLGPASYTFLVVPALVAALAGRMVSIAATVAGGIALGVVQSEATLVHLPWDWASSEILKEVIPFVALVVVLLAAGSALPTRGTQAGTYLPVPAPAPRRPLRFAVALIFAGAIASLVLQGAFRNAVIVSLIGTLLCLSIIVITGYAGQVSLAQMSFAGIGAYVLSRIATDWHVPFPLGAIAAALAAAVAGALLGLATSRTRGVTVVLVSIGTALVIQTMVFRYLSRGILATNRVTPPRPFGLDLAPIAADGSPRIVFAVFVVLVVAAAAMGVLRLRSSGLGRRMLAVRANERAAAAAGVNVGRTKVTAFALSGLIAGLGGALLGYHQGAISAQSFDFSRSILLLAVTYIGGVGSVGGAVVGGILWPGGIVPTTMDRILHLGSYATLFVAVVVTVAVVRRPEGRRGMRVGA
jgi:branched-chain amino acid transport system permease protein